MKTTIELAREAGLRSAVLLQLYGKEAALCDSEIEELRQIERFAALVRADEREACAKVCDELHPGLATKRAAAQEVDQSISAGARRTTPNN
jgi:hypothetical protein